MKRITFLFQVFIFCFLAGCGITETPGTTVEYTNQQPTPSQTGFFIESAPSVVNETATVMPNNATEKHRDTISDKMESTETQQREDAVTHDQVSKPSRPLTSNAWKGLPVIPQVSDNVKSIYKRGLELGRNPNIYSKIGDCGSTPTWFMGDFDRGPKYYDLGKYQHLNEVINAFAGSHQRTSLAARAGFNAPSLFVPMWSDIEQCGSNESPIECEYRINNPIIAFIMLGANDVWHMDEFEPSMRKIIEYSINNGVIPILSTKADNQEGDGSINYTIAKLALEYDIPLINFWRAVQDIPDQGLQEDGVHLTWGNNDFSNPDSMQAAWTIRNLISLQTLDAVWRKAIEKP